MSEILEILFVLKVCISYHLHIWYEGALTSIFLLHFSSFNITFKSIMLSLFHITQVVTPNVAYMLLHRKQSKLFFNLFFHDTI